MLLLGARRARGRAPAKEGRGRFPLPLTIARAISAAAFLQTTCPVVLKRVSRMQTVSQGGWRTPLSAPCLQCYSAAGRLLPSAAWTAQAGSRWGRPACRYAAAGFRGRASLSRPLFLGRSDRLLSSTTTSGVDTDIAGKRYHLNVSHMSDSPITSADA